MAREMIRQDFNHPSVIIWAYIDEVLLRPPYRDPAQLAVYYKAVERVARALEEAVRAEDPSRYTMMACFTTRPTPTPRPGSPASP